MCICLYLFFDIFISFLSIYFYHAYLLVYIILNFLPCVCQYFLAVIWNLILQYPLFCFDQSILSLMLTSVVMAMCLKMAILGNRLWHSNLNLTNRFSQATCGQKYWLQLLMKLMTSYACAYNVCILSFYKFRE